MCLNIGDDGGADERLEDRGFDRLAFADVDGPAHIAVQAGIEQFLISAPRRAAPRKKDHAIKGLGKSLTKNNYDLSNTQSMYLGGGSGTDKTQAFCVSGNCQAGLDNIHGFLQEQGAHPDALAFP